MKFCQNPIRVGATIGFSAACGQNDLRTISHNYCYNRLWAMWELMSLAAKLVNCSFVDYEASDGTWGQMLPNGTWTGLMGDLSNDQVDITIPAMDPLPERIGHFTYLTSTSFGEPRYFIFNLQMSSAKAIDWWLVFPDYVWMAIFGLVTFRKLQFQLSFMQSALLLALLYQWLDNNILLSSIPQPPRFPFQTIKDAAEAMLDAKFRLALQAESLHDATMVTLNKNIQMRAALQKVDTAVYSTREELLLAIRNNRMLFGYDFLMDLHIPIAPLSVIEESTELFVAFASVNFTMFRPMNLAIARAIEYGYWQRYQRWYDTTRFSKLPVEIQHKSGTKIALSLSRIGLLICSCFSSLFIILVIRSVFIYIMIQVHKQLAQTFIGKYFTLVQRQS